MQTKKGFGGVGKLQVASGQAVILALFVLVLLALLIVPLPKFVLDLLLVSNLVLSLVLLLLALFLESWSSLYAFPTILLLSTLFRLSLNVSSTRLILLHGDTGRDAAGRVIEAFGNLVVQGDFMVGVVIFAIIATVNFIVITKGAGRVAEVAARFTLDSLPGKQFAIDADLRNGAIGREQAQQQRQELERESQFYGAMDGAIKFVQGDAIAAIIIVFINAVGGVSIGVSRGMPIDEALRTFGVLTMGDGLVHLIPAVLISVCAGLVTTRVGGGGAAGEQANTGAAVINQVSREPKVIIIAATVLLILSLLPGMPFLPFALIASLMLAGVLWPLRHEGVGTSLVRSLGLSSVARISAPTELNDGEKLTLSYERGSPALLLVEVGAAVDGESLARSFSRYQHELFSSRGFIVPKPELKTNESEANSYRIIIRGRVARSGMIPADASFVVLNQESSNLIGLNSLQEERHPTSLALGRWCQVNDADQQALAGTGVAIYSAAEFIALQIIAAALENISDFFGVAETRALVAGVKSTAPALYEEVIERGVLSIVELGELFRRLLSEKLPIRDPALVLDGIARAAALRQAGEDRSAFLDYLHAVLRRSLTRHVVAEMEASSALRSFVLAPSLQEVFRDAAQDAEPSDARVALPPQEESALRDRIGAVFGPAVARGATPVTIIVPADIRPYVENFLADQFDSREWFRTLAFEELDGRNQLQTVGVLE